MRGWLTAVRRRLTGVRAVGAMPAQAAPSPASEPHKDHCLRDTLPPGGTYPRHGYDFEDEARAAVERVDRFTMCTYEDLVTLWPQVRHLDRAGIPGALVECGTWKGGASGMMALAHLASGPATRPLHLFDSFQGLPPPNAEHDGERANRLARDHAVAPGGALDRCVGTLEENRRLMREIVGYPEVLTHYHVGWFQNTVSPAASWLGPIALLRLDGDWYESVKTCLEALVPLVSPGGFVVVHDYGRWPGCRKAVDEYVAAMREPVFLNPIHGAGLARYFIVSRPPAAR
jgi:O-methyltransferase